jgi:hypothetical protein
VEAAEYAIMRAILQEAINETEGVLIALYDTEKESYEVPATFDKWCGHEREVTRKYLGKIRDPKIRLRLLCHLSKSSKCSPGISSIDMCSWVDIVDLFLWIVETYEPDYLKCVPSDGKKKYLVWTRFVARLPILK